MKIINSPMHENESILTINGGSSSIKFSLYKIENPLKQLFYGQLENIGTEKAKISFKISGAEKMNCISIQTSDYHEAARHLIEWLEKQKAFESIKAIGHRIVHGMKHTGPVLITPAFIRELKKISAYDPDHLPVEIELIEIFRKRYPAIQQIACFDTSFHAGMPLMAKLLPIPRRYYDKGIRRYGFHGLSYTYLMQEFERLAGKEAANGKIILAHLGS